MMRSYTPLLWVMALSNIRMELPSSHTMKRMPLKKPQEAMGPVIVI